jgi:uncharacterized protein (TIGR02147 family)
MKKVQAHPCIYSYPDYREYLRDYFACMKKETPFFSHRYFCSLAGFRTSGAIKLVIGGKRNLSRESILKISSAIGLCRGEHDYFESLVMANQAKDPRERKKHLLHLKQLKGGVPIERIDGAKHQFFSEWRHAVVREMVELPGFDGDPEWIAKRIWPGVAAAKIGESLVLLERLGFIERDARGKWHSTAQAITTENELASETVAEFNRAMIRNAMLASLMLPRSKREISGVTLRISDDSYRQIKQRIVKFKKELLETAIADEGSDRIYQLNIQLFPLMEDAERS